MPLSIPTFTASTSISVNTASIWSQITLGEMSSMEITRSVFSATTETITLIPYTPWAAKVFKSAWMPAPPLQSEPAMVNACFMVLSRLSG